MSQSQRVADLVQRYRIETRNACAFFSFGGFPIDPGFVVVEVHVGSSCIGVVGVSEHVARPVEFITEIQDSSVKRVFHQLEESVDNGFLLVRS